MIISYLLSPIRTCMELDYNRFPEFRFGTAVNIDDPDSLMISYLNSHMTLNYCQHHLYGRRQEIQIKKNPSNSQLSCG